MSISTFVSVGENIHCTRSYKVGGKFIQDIEGTWMVVYPLVDGGTGQLPIPQCFIDSADWENGKCRHTAAACWQGQHGDDAAKAAAIAYIQNTAKRQTAKGATYLDLNVDEYSTDVAERAELMKWLVGVVEEAADIPMSIDSSNTDILRAGLSACDPSRGKPMVNSVSLERLDAVDVAAEFKAVVIASAAGEKDLPSTLEGRMENLARLLPTLTDNGLTLSELHIDPLVFPISVDGSNGTGFMQACTAVRETYGADIHIVAGLSNVSFGMPNRKLINQVFTHLCVDAGADGGIVDPLQINIEILNGMDTESESYKLASALLLGEDDFGMNYITAVREGTI